MKKVLLLNLLLFLCFFFTNAQEAKVYGKVIDKITKQPIAYATIVFNKSSLVADKNGSFSVQGVTTNKNHLKVTAIGFKPYTQENISSEDFLLVELQRTSDNLPEAVVYTGGETIMERAFRRIPDNYYFNDSAAVLGIQQSFLLLNDSDYLQVDTALICYSVTDENNKLISKINLLDNQVSKTKNIDSLQFEKLKLKIYNMYAAIVSSQAIYEPKLYKKIVRKKRVMKSLSVEDKVSLLTDKKNKN